jgi:hypothetical protein
MDPRDSAKLLQEELARVNKERDDLEKARKALQEEFAQASDHGDVVKKARNAIRDLMPDAIMQMHTLLKTAESESVRASLARFIVATGLDKQKFEDDSQTELKELIKELSSQSADT